MRWLPLGLTGVFALKLLVVLQLQAHPLLQPDAGLDTTAYAQLAQQVLAGNIGLGPGLYFVSPLYIYLLAAGLALLHSFTAVRVLQTILGAISVGCIFQIAREWFGTRAAWLAAGLATFTGLFTFYESLILQAAIDPFLTSAALLALTLGLRRSNARWLVAAGCVLGVATLNRPNMVLAAVGLTAALLATRRVRHAAILVTGLLAGMAPVAIRNVVVSRQWTMVSSHGGLNFYIGNNETATGFFHPIPGISPTITGQAEDARRVAGTALGRTVTDAESSDYFFALARTWMRAHPLDAARLFARKLGFVLSAQHVALPHSYPFYAYDSHTMLRFYAIGPWLLLPLGMAGLAFAAPSSQRREYVVWASFVPGYAVAVATFFVSERYRLPLLVPLCVGAGAALDRVIDVVAARRPQALVAPGIAFAVLFTFVNWPRDIHDGRWEEGLRMAQWLVIHGQYEEADRWTSLIAGREPQPGATDYAVGTQLLLVAQPSAALEHLQKAQGLNPGDPSFDYALGQGLLDAGRAGDAIPHLRRGFESGVELPMGGYDLALALQTVEDLPAAVAVIRRIRPADDDPEGSLRLARLAVKVGAPEVADPLFARAVQMRPDQASAHQQFGLNLLVLRRYPEAARELLEAVRLDPRDADALSRLAFCEMELDRPNDARAHAAAALAVDPQDPLATQLLAALGR